jgi:hypothetical protein
MIKEIDKVCPEEGTPDIQPNNYDSQVTDNDINVSHE